MDPIYIRLSDSSTKLSCGASRFWGNPDLPAEMSYPMYVDEDGDEYPYQFVCQINLGDVAPYDLGHLLPESGLLLFFARIDRYLGYYDDTGSIGGTISPADAVKVVYLPECNDLVEKVLVDDDGLQISPRELQICFSTKLPALEDEHALLAAPTHREWESWDAPYEDCIILLQVDSFSGDDFSLNFMDCGVLDFLISPSELKTRRFDNVRAIVLST